jgi:hypothetical protein
VKIKFHETKMSMKLKETDEIRMILWSISRKYEYEYSDNMNETYV